MNTSQVSAGLLGRVLKAMLLACLLALGSCGGGSDSPPKGPPKGSPKTTVISGIVSDDIIVGALVTARAFNGVVLGTAITDSDGRFSITVRVSDMGVGYALTSTGGTMNGQSFDGSMSAIYPARWEAGSSNVTLLTSALAQAANSTVSLPGNLLQKQEAILSNAIVRGVLTSDYFRIEPSGPQTAAIRAQVSTEGVDASIVRWGLLLQEGIPELSQPTTGGCDSSDISCYQDVNSGQALSMKLQGGTVSAPANVLGTCRVRARFDASAQQLDVSVENIPNSTAPNSTPVIACRTTGALTITLDSLVESAPDSCPTEDLHSDMQHCVTLQAGMAPSYVVHDRGVWHRTDRASHSTTARVGDPVRVSRSYGAVLHSRLPAPAASSSTSEQWSGKTAVLFVHGYTMNLPLLREAFGGDDGTWGILPRLVAEDPNTVVLNFQWRTNASYLTVANELARAVDYAERWTGRPVNVVAHSFGGVLARVMLQNLNGNTGAAASKVAGLVTVGTPHSGIVDNVDATGTRLVEDERLPRGWASLPIDGVCGQITCYQSGLNADLADWVKDQYLINERLTDLPGVPDYGYVSSRLSSTVGQLPEHLKVLVLIGQRKGLIDLRFAEDDGLISFWGQRFLPRVGRHGLLSNWRVGTGGATVTERVLGLSPGEMGYPGDPIVGVPTSAYSQVLGAFEGYKHSGIGISALTGGYDTLPSKPEVNIPADCGTAVTCQHDTWVNLKNFLKSVVVFPIPRIPISVGNNHSCVLTESNGVKCWGDNSRGQLGNGSTVSSSVPVDVVGLNGGVLAIAAGESFSCALTQDGSVKCWGGNFSGGFSAVPSDIAGLSEGVTSISVRRNNICVRTSRGGVKCWGSMNLPEVGGYLFPYGDVPLDVPGLSEGVLQVSSGEYHSCALTLLGVKCWGNNFVGQLGNGTNALSLLPIDVVGLNGAVEGLSSGGGQTCALLRVGLKCWGWFNGSNSGSLLPVDVAGLGAEAVGVGAGYGHTCAVVGQGGLKCWGFNSDGQLGNGSGGQFADSFVPVDVVGLRGQVVAFSGGGWHSCALKTDNSVQCWGRNSSGQLGNGQNAPHSYLPVDVRGL